MPAPKSIAGRASNPEATFDIPSPVWSELNAEQRNTLSPLAAEWNSLDHTRKTKWLQIADKFPKMKPEQKTRMQESMREWVKLSPEQRRIARENYLRTKKLNAEQKSAQWESYKNLPEAQKKKLLEEAQTKTQITNLPSATAAKQKPVVPIKSGNRDAQGKPKTPASAISPSTIHPLTPNAKPAHSAPSLTPTPAATVPPIAPIVPSTAPSTVPTLPPSTTPAASSTPAVSTSK